MALGSFGGSLMMRNGLLLNAGNCCCGCGPDGCYPNTIVATFSNNVGCSCADGDTVTLTYTDHCIWIGTGAVCGHDLTITLENIGGEGFQITYHWTDGCAPDDDIELSSQCDPFSLNHDLATPGATTCCDGALLNVQVDYSE